MILSTIKKSLRSRSNIQIPFCNQKSTLDKQKRVLFDKYVQEKGFDGWYETSAKDNVNINQAATKLIEKIIENEGRLAPPRLVSKISEARI